MVMVTLQFYDGSMTETSPRAPLSITWDAGFQAHPPIVNSRRDHLGLERRCELPRLGKLKPDVGQPGPFIAFARASPA
jgi:hypothetical protein